MRSESNIMSKESRGKGYMYSFRSARITLALVCMALISLVMLMQEYSWSAETQSEKDTTGTIASQEVSDNQALKEKDSKVIVFYFHGNVRCSTCKRIERLTVEAVTETFGDELKNGLLELNVVNVEKPENNHFIKEYQLYTRSVIVSEVTDGTEQRWENLNKVWELVRNEEAFKHYIQKEIAGYLQGLPS